MTTLGLEPVTLVTELSRFLRQHGLATTPAASIDAVRILGVVDASDKADIHLALRPLFTSRREDIPLFNELFETWWREAERRHRGGSATKQRDNPPVVPPGDEPTPGSATALTRWASSMAEVEDDEPVPVAAPSRRDVTGTKDFRLFTTDDLPLLEALAARVVRRLRLRRSRRWRRAKRGGRLDPRRIVRLALGTGGDPVRLARRVRAIRRTKLVVLCDVSGSMDLYSRFLLQVLYALQHAFARVETFAFSTRVVRITDSLSRGSYRDALNALAALETGWSGGTRIGESIETVRSTWPRLFDRRTAVIVLSDGWDTGDPEVLGEALRQLRRRAGRIIWLNPLLGSPSYQPLTRGMQAALPHLDIFAPAHDIASLERLASHLSF